MCARYYVPPISDQALAELLGLSQVKIEYDFGDGRDVLPSTTAPIVASDAPGTMIGATWGIKSKIPNGPPIIINSRRDKLLTIKMWSRPFKESRCVIIAGGYYETRAKSAKEGAAPNRYLVNGGQPFAIAGIYQDVVENDLPLRRFSMVTTEPNSFTAQVHDRMPGILRPELIAPWLDVTGVPAEEAETFLLPFEAEKMSAVELPFGYYKRGGK